MTSNPDDKLGFLWSKIKGFFSKPFFGTCKICRRLVDSIARLSLLEKRLLVFFALVFLVLIGIKGVNIYENKTKIVPAVGGDYTGTVYGDLKYLNPLLASSETDNAVSELIYSSLIKIDKEGNITPDAAESWTVSPDNLRYTFVLRDNIYFHDGTKMSSEDVMYTLKVLQDPDFKSPYQEVWKDVEVNQVDERTVVFTLPKVYGPFIYNCDFGILPSFVTLEDLSKKNIGSGPYQFVSTKTDQSRITSISLKRNPKYYLAGPYISKMTLYFYSTKDDATKAFSKNKTDGISGVQTNADDYNDLSFETSRRLALVLNLRLDKLKDQAFRKQILGTERLPDKVSLTLTTLDSPVQHDKAESIKSEFAARNIELTVRYLKSTELVTVLGKKDFELLLYGFDFAHDRDPYPFWHSSQLSSQNYAGYSVTKSDLLIEDARMTSDTVARNAKYDQFYTMLNDAAVVKYYDPIKFNFFLSNRIKGIESIDGTEAAARYFNVNDWYIKDKRVKK